MILQGLKESFPSDFVFYKYIKQTYPKPYIPIARIGFKICYAWKTSIIYKLYTILINETTSPILEVVSDSHQIVDLGSLLKYYIIDIK
ncbi:hypothetical protein CFSAN002367_10704 [Clostridium botulinum CFSAN002367]|nr:hypothetical protein CFSAN002367_10704 [Clostridium botulinum CFSAN002367]